MEREKKQTSSQKERGTQDELEVLKLILEDHPVLKKRVLDRLRVGKASYMERRQRKAPGEAS